MTAPAFAWLAAAMLATQPVADRPNPTATVPLRNGIQIGGEYDQLIWQYSVHCGETRIWRDLLPAEHVTPPDPATARVVEALLRARAAGNATAFRRLVAPGTRARLSQPPFEGAMVDEQGRRTNYGRTGGVETFPFRNLRFELPLTPRPPHRLPGGWVRIEWMHNNVMQFLTWLRIRGGLVRDVEIRPSVAPRIFRAPPPPGAPPPPLPPANCAE